jgi:hypothetical protein
MPTVNFISLNKKSLGTDLAGKSQHMSLSVMKTLAGLNHASCLV